MVKNDDRWLSIDEICAHLGVARASHGQAVEIPEARGGCLGEERAGGGKVSMTIIDMEYDLALSTQERVALKGDYDL